MSTNTTPMAARPKVDIQELIRISKLKAKAIKEGKAIDYYLTPEPTITETPTTNDTLTLSLPTSLASSITVESDEPQLNEQQQLAVTYALEGKSFVLIGPAGTGKTFTVNAICNALIKAHKLPQVTQTTNVLTNGDYGFLACAYTRRATSVVRAGLPESLVASTIHAAIEFAPADVMVFDPATGQERQSMRFLPRRNRLKPLPHTLRFVAMDESSMTSLELEDQLVEALPHVPQRLYIGDICQLKPVFGDSILGYKLIELPVVELTHVYRQKEGEILDFATNIRNGVQLLNFNLPEYDNPRLRIKQFRNAERDGVRLRQFGHLLQEAVHTKDIDPLEGDLILCPYNVNVGTIELNKWVADYYDQAHQRQVYTIIAGRETKHLAIGDKVLIDREDAIITNIKVNPKYVGRFPPRPAVKVNRWGSQRLTKYAPDHIQAKDDESDDSLEAMLSEMGSSLSIDDIVDDVRKLEASHVVEYMYLSPSVQRKRKYEKNPDKGNIESLSSAGDLNGLELSYVITVHKAQGSQAKHVMLLMSNQHKTMLHRELLYTAVTRAQSRLTIYCDKGNLTKCINNPRIKGNTIAEKSEYFRNKIAEKQEE